MHYVLVYKIHIYMPKMTLPSLLTQIFFLYIKFGNFWYIICLVPNLTPIWPQSHWHLFVKWEKLGGAA